MLLASRCLPDRAAMLSRSETILISLHSRVNPCSWAETVRKLTARQEYANTQVGMKASKQESPNRIPERERHMGKSVSLPWGKGRLEIPLPPSWTLLGELVPRSAEAPHDPADACLEALNSSIGAAPLGSRKLKGRSVVLVVDDHSRPTPVKEFIKPVLDELARAGVEDRDLTILIATGVHRSSTAEEVEKKIGRQSADRFRWLCHNAYDSEGLADLGSTSRGTRVFVNKLLVQADLIVCVGSIDPHLLLGFGGGLKMIIPGCAGAETIGRNHLQGMDAERFNYVGVSGDDSPMRLDLEEAAQLLKKDIFIVNAALKERARPTQLF